MKQEPKKGYYVVVKHKGSGNGDLIVGIIDSVRSNGKVISTNLLTGNPSTKDIKVFMKRNVIVPKKRALAVVQMFKNTGSKAQARELAVDIANDVRGRVAVPAKDDPVTQLEAAYNALSARDKQRFEKRLWGRLRKNHAPQVQDQHQV